VLRGGAAGAVGTAAMDLLWFARYRRGGGRDGLLEWELSANLESWDDAPAPAIVGKRLLEALLQRDVPASRAALISNVTHWGYGVTVGAAYGVLAGSRRSGPVIPAGIGWGAAVWASSYVTLPLAKVYRPIWEYDAQTLAKDLSAHLVFGVATATAFAAAR
jgi:hypothetical protein